MTIPIVFDYLFAAICAYALIMYAGRLIRLLFNPRFLQHKNFEFPQDKFRKAMLLISTMFLLFLAILMKLDMV